MLSSLSNPIRIKSCCTSCHAYVDSVYSGFIDLVVVLENNDIKQLIFKLDKTRAMNEEAAVCEIKNEATELNLKKNNARSQEMVTKLRNLSVILLNIIRDPGLSTSYSVLKAKDNFYLLIDSAKYGKISPSTMTVSDLYLSDDNGTFGILQQNPPTANAFFFENFTKQRVLEVKPCLDMDRSEHLFQGALITKDFVYIVHTTSRMKRILDSVEKNSGDEDETSQQQQKSLTLCKYEIMEKIDFIEMLSKHLYILCRRGIIEMYKIKCLKSFHRVKLVFSINSLSTQITDLVLNGGFKFEILPN